MQHAAARFTLVNGVVADTVSAADRGLQFGDGLFETMRLEKGAIQLLDLHLDRLREGLARLHIALPLHAVQQDLNSLLKNHPPQHSAVLKLIVTRGESVRGYRLPDAAEPTRVLRVYDFQELPANYSRQGVALRFCRMRVSENPMLAGIKHLNRLEQVLARAEWSDDNIFEGLMLDSRGHIVAGTMSNIFICRNDTLMTPGTQECGIAGVMRRYILDNLAPQLKLNVLLKPLSCNDLARAEEVFISNSLIHILPVHSCEYLRFTKGPVTASLQSALYANIDA